MFSHQGKSKCTCTCFNMEIHFTWLLDFWACQSLLIYDHYHYQSPTCILLVPAFTPTFQSACSNKVYVWSPCCSSYRYHNLYHFYSLLDMCTQSNNIISVTSQFYIQHPITNKPYKSMWFPICAKGLVPNWFSFHWKIYNHLLVYCQPCPIWPLHSH